MQRQVRVRAQVLAVGIALLIAIGAMPGHTANAATPTVGLGTAASYSVLAGTPSIANTGPTTIDRDLGIHPATSVIGFPPGIVGGTIHAGDAVALQAKSDLTVAYLDAASRPVTTNHTALGGLTLVGGVYNSGPAPLDLTGTLTLDGQNDPNSVWIFQAQSNLTTASASSVEFIRGGSPCNVFWQVTSSAALGSGSTFVGTILALTSITLANGVTVLGRALARNGNVTLINDTFITGGCTPQTVFIPPTRPPFTVAPSATATPTATPTAIPSAVATATPTTGTPTTATPTPIAAPTAGPAATPAPVATPAASVLALLPSSSTQDLDGVPTWIFVLALAAFGLLAVRVRARERVATTPPKI